MNKLILGFVVCAIFISNALAGDWQAQQQQRARERAAYWAERGYSFNPDYMTAWSMDQKVKDIQRAKYWKERGYNFDPNYMTAWSMDQKVKDIERAKYWAKKGYRFDPNYMTAWSMDQKVKDIERARYWKKKGYNFDPSYMTAWAMDQAVAQSKSKQSGVALHNTLSSPSHSDSESLFKVYETLNTQQPTKDDDNEFSVEESRQEKFGSQHKSREDQSDSWVYYGRGDKMNLGTGDYIMDMD